MERDKALEMALGQIDKQFGKGSVMRMGDKEIVPMAAISLLDLLRKRLLVGAGGQSRPSNVC